MKIPKQRTIIDIRNELVRTRANIATINDHLFSEEDREVLLPWYQNRLKQLEREEKVFRTTVNDPEVVTE